MIVPDVNLLVHAYNAESAVHARARLWWETLLSEPAPVGLTWPVLLGFIRLTTHARVMLHPLPVDTAVRHVEAWLAQPQVSLLHPGDRHAAILFALLRQLGSGGDLTTDAHLAALAIEHQAEVHTTDADFARFAGLRHRNPVAG
jgi:toxin-antitoxin system PIN domain toxin